MSKAIRIIAGLGNPEDKYERTLHNAGFWFVDAVARKYGGQFRYEKKFDADICRVTMHGEDVWLVKPQSYMNESGGPVRGLLDYYRLRPAEMLVAHDEIDLEPGTLYELRVTATIAEDSAIANNEWKLVFIRNSAE